MLFAISINQGLHIHQLDVLNAFWHDNIQEMVSWTRQKSQLDGEFAKGREVNLYLLTIYVFLYLFMNLLIIHSNPHITRTPDFFYT